MVQIIEISVQKFFIFNGPGRKIWQRAGPKILRNFSLRAGPENRHKFASLFLRPRKVFDKIFYFSYENLIKIISTIFYIYVSNFLKYSTKFYRLLILIFSDINKFDESYKYIRNLLKVSRKVDYVVNLF